MNNWETFESAAIAVTEQSKGNIGVNTANFQLAYDKVTEAGGDYSVQSYIDALLKARPGEFAEAKNANELRAAYYERLRVDYNREMQNPLRIDEVKAMARSERAEKEEAAAQAKVVQIAAQAKQAVASGTPVLPETYGDYTLDGKGLRKMAREDMTKFRYLNSVYGTAQVNQRLNS